MTDGAHPVHVETADLPATTDIVARLRQDGQVMFQDITSRSDLLALVASVGTVVRHRDSDLDGVAVVSDRCGAGAGMAGFTSVELRAHTDRSGVVHHRRCSR